MDTNALLEYYKKIGKMTAAELTDLWEETDCETFNEMLEVLPPARWKDGAFMVGECVTHSEAGALYDAYVEVDGRFFWRPAPIHSFDPAQYKREVRAKFANSN
jgi:hypothetical protein